jgi:MFS family permease
VKLPHGLRALRHRDFRWFFAGQGVSQIGTWLQMIATSWLVYHLSGSTLLLGVAAFAQQIPFLVLAPVAGVFVDRFDRRRLLMVTNSIAALQASAMFAVVALGVVQPWHLIAGNLVLGLVNACDAPARQSILIQLVGGRADLASAIALNSIMMNLARFLGPMLGGVLIAALGERWGFGANAASYFAMLFALTGIPSHPRLQHSAGLGILDQLVAGARYAYGFLPSRCALLLLTSASLTVGSYVSMMPWFASEAFHGDSGTLGLLISAAGLGALTGMVYLALRSGIRGLFRLISRTVALAGAALCVFSFSTTLWLARRRSTRRLGRCSPPHRPTRCCRASCPTSCAGASPALRDVVHRHDAARGARHRLGGRAHRPAAHAALRARRGRGGGGVPHAAAGDRVRHPARSTRSLGPDGSCARARWARNGRTASRVASRRTRNASSRSRAGTATHFAGNCSRFRRHHRIRRSPYAAGGDPAAVQPHGFVLRYAARPNWR